MEDKCKEWRPIPLLPGYYASISGEIRGPRKTRKLHMRKCGYLYFSYLKPEGKISGFAVARAVCMAFHGLPPAQDSHCDHINADCTDNSAENLRWLSPEGNLSRRAQFGGAKKVTDDQVREIRSSTAPRKDLAATYGVAPSTISGIRSGKERRHVA